MIYPNWNPYNAMLPFKRAGVGRDTGTITPDEISRSRSWNDLLPQGDLLGVAGRMSTPWAPLQQQLLQMHPGLQQAGGGQWNQRMQTMNLMRKQFLPGYTPEGDTWGQRMQNLNQDYKQYMAQMSPLMGLLPILNMFRG